MQHCHVSKYLAIALTLSISLQAQLTPQTPPRQDLVQKLFTMVGLATTVGMHFLLQTKGYLAYQRFNAPEVLNRELIPIPSSTVPQVPASSSQLSLVPIVHSTVPANISQQKNTSLASEPKRLKDLPVRMVTGLSCGVVFGGTYLFLPYIYFSALLGIMLLIILSTEWPQFPARIKSFTPLYPILPFCLLAYLNQIPAYHNLLLYLFAMVITNDAGAYFAGSLLGKTKIAPTISPNKSLEGLAGGFALSTLILMSMLFASKKPLSLEYSIPFSSLVTVFSAGGDLFESWLKRKAGIKDTGTLLPGHGGLLDRVDSMMGASFLFFLLRDRLPRLLLTQA